MARPVAIVTGGTRGIGAGISEALASQGFDLVLGYGTNAVVAEQQAERLRSLGARVELRAGDVAEDSTLEALAAAPANLPGPLRAVVHNAGQYLGVTSDNCLGLPSGGGRLGSLPADGMRQMDYYYRIYVGAFVRLVELTVQKLEPGSTVLAVSGMGCNCNIAPAEAYDLPAMGKAPMEVAVRYYAKNLAAQGITVNAIIPGVIETDAWRALSKGKGKGEDLAMARSVAGVACPMRRTATARELGDVAAFLCGPGGRYITGVALPVDGGLHLGRPSAAPPSAPAAAPPGAAGASA
eukprot:CAMPEP_0204528740 /NCGR_PEP_ID=MMETSP0661-20131031/9691_1 /ASSEMBLY_ACC=CAM_ASM_000606 /TAXON_ID=109239 /ORGANISM="Alexandrium margalefi, Strain AMGDE01CS-322" /LENGTH=294 /DNA_ID=CAMNT_0051534733 /DNA_START=55 /DNA_END=939 /DNA_ORIENTATION=-